MIRGFYMENKMFKTAVIPVLLMIIGLKRYTGDLLLSIAIGTGIYIVALLLDEFIKKW